MSQLPFAFSLAAIFAVVVVLPAPWRPAIIMTVISLAGFKAISVVSEPISFISSSVTILITVCPGVRLPNTSSPTARS